MAGSVKTRQQAKKAAVAAAEDEGLDPTQYYEKRLSALAAQKAAGVNPYPHKFEVELSIPEYVKQYGNLNSGDNVEDVEERIAGRLLNKRSSSSKLFFYDLHGDGAKVQVMADARKSDLDAEEFTQFHSSVKQGDIVGIIGFPGKSKRGELVIIPKTFIVLSHCLHMMPRQNVGPGSENAKNTDIWVPGLPRNPETYTLKDQETRYRKRYLDLMLNSEVREIFKTRSKVISYIRHFLDELDFLEVETHMMSTVARGDAAQPFFTHHNDLNMKLYMRNAPELYLKELVVGGLNRVYEIGRQFGNGEIDLTHKTELTSAVCMAFADYNDLMKLAEDMLSGMVKELTGGYKIKYHANGLDNDPIEIDFTPPFRRIDMIDELEKTTSLSIPKDLSGTRANKYLSDACMKFGIKCPPPQTTAQLLDELVGHFLEETYTNPTFIIDHPKILSPLAKWHRSKAGLTETFQLIINKNSVGDAYTALNDPLVLRQCLADQLKDRRSGGGEAMALDETFCTALEYGLPPTSGWLLGIDRFTMLLTDSQDMKEVLPFPVMKAQHKPSNIERMSRSSIYRAPTTRESETADAAKELASSIIQIVQQYSTEQNAQARATELVPRFLEYHPRKFRGREEPGAAEEWLRELERIFKHIAYTDEQRVLCAVFQLVEDAYFWWESHTKTMTPEQLAGLTWEEFEQIITRKYIPSSYLKGKEAEFHQLKQGSMTVTEYERSFHRLSRYASYLVDTDAESAQQFKQGLRPEIGCILPDSLTFAETVERAQKIECAARELDNGKRKWESVSPGYRASNQQQRRK